MSVSKEQVKHIAKLARLELTDGEAEAMTTELNQILDYMDKLNELNTENTEILSHPVSTSNVFRADKTHKSIERQDALKVAPNADDEYFHVPKVISSSQ